ncbi:MAG: hypothetical protein ACK6DA_03095 [Candidatus Kapaibacterium sp.]
MASPYSIFSTDKNLESGAGVDICYPGFTITIHRAGGSNAKYATTLKEKAKPHSKMIANGMLDEKIASSMLIEAFAESVVIGWKGVTDETGKEMPFSVENCVKLFTDLPDLYADIKAQAEDFKIFQKANEEAERKN